MKSVYQKNHIDCADCAEEQVEPPKTQNEEQNEKNFEVTNSSKDKNSMRTCTLRDCLVWGNRVRNTCKCAGAEQSEEPAHMSGLWSHQTKNTGAR